MTDSRYFEGVKNQKCFNRKQALQSFRNAGYQLSDSSFYKRFASMAMLLMEHPRRLSTDIDIIAEPGTDLDKYLERASEIFPFKTVEEQKRNILLFPYRQQTAFWQIN